MVPYLGGSRFVLTKLRGREEIRGHRLEQLLTLSMLPRTGTLPQPSHQVSRTGREEAFRTLRPLPQHSNLNKLVSTTSEIVGATPQRRISLSQVSSVVSDLLFLRYAAYSSDCDSTGYGPGTSEAQIRQIFSQHTQVVGVVLKGNFTFVNTSSREAAVKAREMLQGSMINGGPLRINFAKETGRLGTSFDLYVPQNYFSISTCSHNNPHTFSYPLAARTTSRADRTPGVATLCSLPAHTTAETK